VSVVSRGDTTAVVPSTVVNVPPRSNATLDDAAGPAENPDVTESDSNLDDVVSSTSACLPMMPDASIADGVVTASEENGSSAAVHDEQRQSTTTRNGRGILRKIRNQPELLLGLFEAAAEYSRSTVVHSLTGLL